MHRPEFSGQEAIEFILISALVFFAAIFSFIVLGDKLSEFFMKDSAAVKVANQKAPAITASQTQKYSFSHDLNTGVSDAPLYSAPERATKKIDYEGDTFTLDFGDLKLTNIPADFNNVIKSTGSAGETSIISGLLEQIAMQLASEGTPESLKQSEAIKKLAVTGHNIAYVQEIAENLILQCNGDAKCLRNLNENRGVTLKQQYPALEEFDNSFYTVDTNWDITDLMWNVSFATVLQNDEKTLATNAAGKPSMLNNFYMAEYKKLMKDPDLKPSVKNIIEELTYHMSVTVEDFRYSYITSISANDVFWDPSTGNVGSPYDDPYTFGEQEASKITNLDSALICAAGKHTDTGKKCH